MCLYTCICIYIWCNNQVVFRIYPISGWEYYYTPYSLWMKRVGIQTPFRSPKIAYVSMCRSLRMKQLTRNVNSCLSSTGQGPWAAALSQIPRDEASFVAKTPLMNQDNMWNTEQLRSWEMTFVFSILQFKETKRFQIVKLKAATWCIICIQMHLKVRIGVWPKRWDFIKDQGSYGESQWFGWKPMGVVTTGIYRLCGLGFLMNPPGDLWDMQSGRP